MRIYRLFMMSLILGVAPQLAKALPCLERKVPLTFTGVSVFQDCEKSTTLYFVPQDFSITEKMFDGASHFYWRPTSEGADVVMQARLFVRDDLILRALRDIKTRIPERFTFGTFEIRNGTLSGFGSEEDGVVNAQLQSPTGFSDGTFRLFAKLNSQGVRNWKDSVALGEFVLQAASLNFEMRFQKDGADLWIPTTNPLRVESIPRCILAGEGSQCETRDRTQALLRNGNGFGARYFHMQYASCQDFADGYAFRAPQRQEIAGDTSLSEADIDIVYNAAFMNFANSRDAQRNDCRPFLDEFDGHTWLSQIARSRNLNCSNRSQLPWSNVVSLIPPSASIDYRRGVWRAYTEICPNLPVTTEFVCDGRNGTAACNPKMQTPTSVCFAPDILRSLVGTSNAVCSFNSFEMKSGFALINSPVVKVSLSKAQTEETCVTTHSPVTAETQLLGRIFCEGLTP
jgi:hypothetical protein